LNYEEITVDLMFGRSEFRHFSGWPSLANLIGCRDVAANTYRAEADPLRDREASYGRFSAGTAP
jgi:hypothetical protein